MKHYSDECIELITKGDGVFIKCRKPIELKNINEILSTMPRLMISNFSGLRDAIIKATFEEVRIGVYKPLIELEVSKDEMMAYFKLNMLKQDYLGNEEQIISDIITLLQIEQISVGILSEVFSQPIELQKKILIAQGTPAIPGTDAKLSYFTMSQKKPEFKTDGGVDHFEINLIDPINSGDWLGEKIFPTEGIAGKTVKGNEIPAKSGKDLKLKYDSETVQLQMLGDSKAVLKAKINGAVSVVNQEIRVEQHLIIDGNVDYSTGNINFDGFVTVKGTVEDCFSVIGTKDVSILGKLGVGAVALIESKDGSVSITGGINGKGSGFIRAAKNVYLKYCNEAQIEAEGIVQIGAYAYDADIKASKVILMKNSSKVVGGKIIAKHQIISGVIGNQFERETNIQVIGFDRTQMKQELDNVQVYYLDVIERANKIKRQLDIFHVNLDKLDEKATNTYHIMQREFDKIIIEMTNIKESVHQMEEVLRIRGDGEIKILNQVFPKSSLEIKNHMKRIEKVLTGSFYVKDNSMHRTDI